MTSPSTQTRLQDQAHRRQMQALQMQKNRAYTAIRTLAGRHGCTTNELVSALTFMATTPDHELAGDIKRAINIVIIAETEIGKRGTNR